MIATLLIALAVGVVPPISKGKRCPRPMAIYRIHPPLNKPLQQVVRRDDPLFGYLIGQTKAEVSACQGRPAVKEKEVWTYHELGDRFLNTWRVKFRQGKVVEVEVIEKAVGCVYFQ